MFGRWASGSKGLEASTGAHKDLNKRSVPVGPGVSNGEGKCG